MGTQSRYDLIVIGAGPGGYVAAIRAAQLGLSVAIAEKNPSPGGACLNVGCIPSKVLLDTTEVLVRARESCAQGLLTGSVGFDLPTIMERKSRIIRQLTSGVSSLLKGNGVDVFHGVASVASTTDVIVNNESSDTTALSAKSILIATGSIPAELPFLRFDGAKIVSSTEALSFHDVPKDLVVIGGGPIGLELGSVWSRLGSKVTIVELMPQILPGWDEQVAQLLHRLLGRQGMSVNTSNRVNGAEVDDEKIALSVSNEEGAERTIEADRVLVAVGRRPYTDGLGLSDVGVRMEEGTGRVAVNERFQTSVESIYAIGDVVRGPQLAHKAEDEGVAVAESLAGKPGHVNYDTVPGVVYTWPEAASVGRTEQQLADQHIEFSTGTFPFRANGRALAADAPDGFVKVIADTSTDRVLGVHIVGPWASDLIAEAAVAMEFGASSEDLARTMHAHPTLPEAVKEAALDVDRRAIHIPPRR